VLQVTFHRRSTLLAENMAHLIGQAQFTLKRIFAPMKAQLERAQRPDESKLDVLAAVTLVLDLLNSSATAERMTVLTAALCVIQNSPLLKEADKDELKYQMWKIDQLAALQPRLRALCDTSFLYFTIDLVPLFVRDMYEHPEQVHRLPYLLAALRDPAPMLLALRRWFDAQPPAAISFASTAVPPAPTLAQLPYYECYQREVARMLDAELVLPLCREVETDLRLHIHSVALQQESLRDKKLKHLTTLLQLKPFRLFASLVWGWFAVGAVGGCMGWREVGSVMGNQEKETGRLGIGVVVGRMIWPLSSREMRVKPVFNLRHFAGLSLEVKRASQSFTVAI
jgi:WASH complex subunit 7